MAKVRQIYFDRNWKFAERFLKNYWKKVKKTETCWLWTGAIHPRQGRGQVGYRGQVYYAPRMAWAIKHGYVPADINVLHSCDNPTCVNPAHLWLGSQYDNVQDCLKKGRFSKRAGEANVKAKLTAFQAGLIALDPRASVDIAAAFGVTTSTVRYIKTGKSWGEYNFLRVNSDKGLVVLNRVVRPRKARTWKKPCKVTDEEIRHALSLINRGVPRTEVVKKTGISDATLYRRARLLAAPTLFTYS